jgi:hypothetical protein
MKQLNELPKFNNEDEEREFWTTHSFLDYYDIKKFQRVPPAGQVHRDLVLPLELDREVERLSRDRNVDVQEMIRQLLAAGLKQQRLQPGA